MKNSSLIIIVLLLLVSCSNTNHKALDLNDQTTIINNPIPTSNSFLSIKEVKEQTFNTSSSNIIVKSYKDKYYILNKSLKKILTYSNTFDSLNSNNVENILDFDSDISNFYVKDNQFTLYSSKTSTFYNDNNGKIEKESEESVVSKLETNELIFSSIKTDLYTNSKSIKSDSKLFLNNKLVYNYLQFESDSKKLNRIKSSISDSTLSYISYGYPHKIISLNFDGSNKLAFSLLKNEIDLNDKNLKQRIFKKRCRV